MQLRKRIRHHRGFVNGNLIKLNELTTEGHRFKLAIVFTEPVFKKDEDGGGAIDGCGLEIGATHPPGSEKPEVKNFKQDPENPLRYTFTVEPKNPPNTATYVPFLNSRSCVDAAYSGAPLRSGIPSSA